MFIYHRAHHDLKQQDRMYHHQRRRALVVDHSSQYCTWVSANEEFS
jgi:hypothetical protein